MCGISAILSVLVALTGAAKGADSPPPVPAKPRAEAARRMEESIAKQKAAIQARTGGSADSFFSAPWAGPALIEPPAQAPAPLCEPLREAEADPLILAAATAHQIKPAVLRAVIRQESAFRPCAVSPKGAMGLMQLMPATAKQFEAADPFDPAQNIQAGARYLKDLLTRFQGDLKLALAAYNAGPGRVEGPVPAVPAIAETQEYVQKILKEVGGAP